MTKIYVLSISSVDNYGYPLGNPVKNLFYNLDDVITKIFQMCEVREVNGKLYCDHTFHLDGRMFGDQEGGPSSIGGLFMFLKACYQTGNHDGLCATLHKINGETDTSTISIQEFDM